MSSKRKISRAKSCFLWTIIIVSAVCIATAVWGYRAAHSTYERDAVTIIIPKGSTDASIGDSLKSGLGDFGTTVYRLWALRGGNPEKASGVYEIVPGERAWSVASRIKSGRSSVVKITFNNIRLLSELAQRVSKSFPWTANDFLQACDSVLPKYGFSTAQYPAAFLPDTYEFYASAEPTEVVSGLLKYRNKFWSDKRIGTADSLGLTPIEIATLASIVEEESNNKAERPTIARLYMNRLAKKMKLQADPTVKYALGDFSIRRVMETHTGTESPYNTYFVNGLPPGPIRIPEAATMDAVLSAPENNYLYMCAKPGGQGTHNFSTDYSQHLRYARAYRAWLDSLNIK